MTSTGNKNQRLSSGYLSLAVFIILCLAISAAGGAITLTSVNDWYLTLTKPFFNPPDWIFGPTWTLLYLCIAVAGWRVWQNSIGQLRQRVMAVYAIQLGLNFGWSFLFFGLKRIDLALINISVLLAVIVINGVLFWRVDQLAGALFAPYACWVAFATLLNTSIWLLN